MPDASHTQPVPAQHARGTIRAAAAVGGAAAVGLATGHGYGLLVHIRCTAVARLRCYAGCRAAAAPPPPPAAAGIESQVAAQATASSMHAAVVGQSSVTTGQSSSVTGQSHGSDWLEWLCLLLGSYGVPW
jgi:hypothetical protein